MQITHTGQVFSIKDNIANIIGLDLVTSGEMVSGDSGQLGLVLNLEADRTGVVLLDNSNLSSGDFLKRMYKTLSISTDIDTLSNVFDAIGTSLNKMNILSNTTIKKWASEFGSIFRAGF